jgi:hypothetical protein
VQNSLANTISLGAKIQSVQVANSTYVVKDDTAVNVGGGYIVVTGQGFQSNCQVLISDGTTSNLACSVSFVSSTTVRAQVPAKSAGTYSVYVINGDGDTAIRVNALQYSAEPTWVTTSPLTNQSEDTSVSIQLSATGATSYVLQTGSTLPTGLTLSANGLISGTVNTNVSVDTTYNFTVEAIDTENQETPKAFSVTITVGDSDFYRTTLLLDGEGTNNANNNVIRDSSNNNYAITKDGNVTQSSFNPFSPNGWSVYLDGSGDYLTVANTSLFDINSNSQSFTLEAWIYPTGTNASGPENYRFTSILSKAVVYLSFGYTSTGVLRFYTYDGNERYINSSSGVIKENEWQHVAVVSNAGAITMYRNGTSVATGSLIRPQGGGTGVNPKIGHADTTAAADALKGYISNLRISNTAVYTGAFTPSTTALTSPSGTEFLAFQSNRFLDTNTQATAKNITPIGETKVLPFSPFKPTSSTKYSTTTYGGSLYFDGNTDVVYATEASSQFTFGTGDFEYECWFYNDRESTYTGQETIFGRNSTGNVNVPYIYITPTSRNISVYYSSGISTGTSTVKTGQWNHLLVSRVSGTIRIFLNGVQESSDANTTDLVAAEKLVVGGQWTGNSNMYKGWITGIRVRKGSGSTSVTIPTTPPTPITNTNLLLLGTNAGIFDWTTRNNIETLGGAKISTTQSKYGTSSLYVDGVSGSRFVLKRNPTLDLYGDFTVEGWFFCDSLASGTYRRLWSFGTFSEANSFDAEFNNNEVTNKFRINFNGLTNGSNSSETSTNAIGTNQWYHVAVTRSSGTIKGWLNGSNVITITGSQTAYVNKAQDVYIGSLHGYETTAGAIWSGYIEDFRISQFCRYTNTFTPPTAALQLNSNAN